MGDIEDLLKFKNYAVSYVMRRPTAFFIPNAKGTLRIHLQA
jgi:hypothetical protein